MLWFLRETQAFQAQQKFNMGKQNQATQFKTELQFLLHHYYPSQDEGTIPEYQKEISLKTGMWHTVM